MAELIISISGMRGTIGENLTPAIAAEYGAAFGSHLRKSASGKKKLKVCVGRDSRPSGQMLTAAVTAGLCSVGVDVVDLGIVTTPCVGIMVRHLKCAGGIVITASHNPVQYNGIKLLLDNGIAPPAPIAASIKQRYLEKKLAFVPSVENGKTSFDDQTDAIHIEKVLAIVEKKTIRRKRLKVVLDSVNGAGGRITKKLLAQFGCQVTAINDEPTGLFAHTPEPTAGNLAGFCKVVKKHKADIGFAQDPDADRLAIVDEKGRYIGEEYTLALAAKYIFSRKKGCAAANLSTSRMIDDIAAKAGGKVIRTPVGEANVAEAMIKNKCIAGGEGNGGVIDLRVGPIRDSLVGIALVLQLMADTGKSISELADECGNYAMLKEKFEADKALAEKIIEAAKREFSGAKVNTSDGCRFDFADAWVHLRTSNTEPVMRVIAEAPTEEAAKAYVGKVMALRDGLAG
jgi:phosphomannomutase